MDFHKIDSDHCEVIWNNLELRNDEGKRIISNTSGGIRSNTITAIMGPSGSGKTSLLSSIAGGNMPGMILNGEIKINGLERDPKTWPRLVSYVRQQVHCYEWQTVYETLYFVAKIKCKDHSDISGKVEELINLLGLTSSRDTFLINLSGGEKVRVSIGIELLGDPLVILLDEPLSGLDSFNALNILMLLKRIANLNKAILITIHQPSYKMVEFFDSIILMCQGTSVFEGTVSGCIQFFEDCGFEVPPKATPTDFFLDVLALDTRTEKLHEESQKRIQIIIKEWNFIRQPKEPAVLTKIKTPKEYSTGTRYTILLARSIQNYYRNFNYLKVKIFQKLFTAFIFGSTFFNTGVIGANIFAFRGILTFICQSELFGVSNPIMNLFIEEKKIISRERMSGLYTGFEAYFSKFLTELLFNLLYSMPYNIIVYMFIGLRMNLKTMLEFLFIIFSILCYAISWGLTIGTLASTTQSAHALGVTFTVAFFLYSGAFSNPQSHPQFLRWLFWLSPIHYGYRALVHNQLSGIEDPENTDFLKVTGERTIKNFGMDGFGVLPSVLALFLFTACLQMVGSTVLHLRTSNNLRILKRANQTV
ncbi:uncharacterized protein VICG_01164 [Vittaforma corneae ATCC 50505]|uniref:ABC transporter domain-containing protein n=1 Tax=Vittaforma corneae (strain ATCC 50505) TaxID=993615 RepID=L2GNB9_VITCO|nr:uncharacterized protein VICG_01164 [Vittaforma corneae ATCC 50505]ELA41812.1 hypothetical protein VICG_01164 [Vittaforma corneae ATCC 50505]